MYDMMVRPPSFFLSHQTPTRTNTISSPLPYPTLRLCFTNPRLYSSTPLAGLEEFLIQKFLFCSLPLPFRLISLPKMGKVFTLAEVSEHNNNKDCWLVIDGKVYDVTKFLEDHPGGDDVLLTATGKDATDDFEDVGHSSSARAMMDEFYVGDIDRSSVPTIPSKTNTYTPPKQPQNNPDKSSEFIIKLLQFLVPLLILGLAFGVRSYTKSSA